MRILTKKELAERKGFAVLRGHEVQWGQPPRPHLAVYCPYCDAVHIHGINDELRSGGISHRVAHCDRDDCGEKTPLLDKGYFIGVYRKKDLDALQLKPK
jgi:hypothetical protein